MDTPDVIFEANKRTGGTKFQRLFLNTENWIKQMMTSQKRLKTVKNKENTLEVLPRYPVEGHGSDTILGRDPLTYQDEIYQLEKELQTGWWCGEGWGSLILVRPRSRSIGLEIFGRPSKITLRFQLSVTVSSHEKFTITHAVRDPRSI